MSFTSQQPSGSKAILVGKMKKSLEIMSIASISFAPFAARAGLFQSSEQDELDSIGSAQRYIAELLDNLKPMPVNNPVGISIQTQVLKGGKEDSDVVRNYMEVYIKPLQLAMAKLAPRLKLDDSAATERISILPALMKGHILELTEAIDKQVASEQAKEVEEVQETLAEYLKIASAKYNVNRYIPIRPLSDAELFGPLGCEFWGKKRVPGSNACAPNEG